MKIVKFVVFIFCSVAVHFLDCSLQLDVGNVKFAIAPAIVAAGITAASTLASIFSSKNNAKRSNQMSLQMQREQNAWNLNQWEREKAFAQEMWNKENEYNSAKNQRKRLEEAGLNPYLMLNGGSAGVAEGVSSPSGHPAASAFTPAVFDPNLIQSGIESTGHMFQTMLGTKKQLAENHIAEVDAQYKEQQILQGLIKMSEETANLRGDTRKKAQETINLAVDEQLKRAAQRIENFNVEHLDQRFNMELERFDSDMASARVLRKIQLNQNSRADQQLAADIKHINALITKAFAEADLASANRAVAFAQEHLFGQQANTEGERTREQREKANKAADLIQAEIDNIERSNRGKITTEGKNIGDFLRNQWNNARKQEFNFIRKFGKAIKNR